MTIKAIETVWKGYRFRSRLEARWAVFFDALGLRWEYEPEGFDLGEEGWYLPDFFLQGNGHRGPYIEIKATEPTKLEIRKMDALCTSQGAYGMIFYGGMNRPEWMSFHKEVGRDFQEMDNPAIGSRGAYPFSEYSDEATAAAIIAARSARFEHGEVPA
jgi:hypothetical protein